MTEGARLASRPDGLVTFDKTSEVNPPGLNRYISRPNVPNAYEIFPGLRTTDPLFFSLNHSLAVRLTEELPPSERAGALLEAPGISEGWGRLYNLMGVPHTPEGVPPYSTEGYHAALTAATGIKSDAVTSTLSPASRRRAELLAKVLIGRGHARSVHIKSAVVTGIPTMTSDLLVKHEIVKTWHDNFNDVASLIVRGDLRTLAAKYGIYFTYFTGRRYQPDYVTHWVGETVWLPSATVPESVVATGKKRPVLDHTGKWVVADKAPPERVAADPLGRLFLRCRSRKISASPLAATYPLRIISAMCEGYFDDLYAYTMYHRGIEDITEKLALKSTFFCSDVDNHDVNMPRELRDILCARAGEVFGPFFGHLLSLTFRMPQLIRNDYEGGKGVRLEGDPFNRAAFDAVYVNPSGHPWTSILAKFAGVFFVYDAFCELGEIEEGEDALIDFLRGRAHVSCLNAGDNMVVCDYPGGLTALQAASPYCRYSETFSFQGNVIVRAGSGHTVAPNISTYVGNWFTPGRPVGHQQRGEWAGGWLERQSVYAASLAYPTAHRIVNEVTREVLGESIDELAKRARRGAVVEGKSLVDQAFELDPDIIYYKLHPEEVSKELLEKYFFTISPAQFDSLFTALLAQRL